MHMYIYIHMFSYTYIHLCIRMCICMSVFKYVWLICHNMYAIHIFTHKHTRTHIHTCRARRLTETGSTHSYLPHRPSAILPLHPVFNFECACVHTFLCACMWLCVFIMCMYVSTCVCMWSVAWLYYRTLPYKNFSSLHSTRIKFPDFEILRETLLPRRNLWNLVLGRGLDPCTLSRLAKIKEQMSCVDSDLTQQPSMHCTA